MVTKMRRDSHTNIQLTNTERHERGPPPTLFTLYPFLNLRIIGYHLREETALRLLLFSLVVRYFPRAKASYSYSFNMVEPTTHLLLDFSWEDRVE